MDDDLHTCVAKPRDEPKTLSPPDGDPNATTSHEELFVSLFDQTPRAIQAAQFTSIVVAIRDELPAAYELPTGTGKTLLGLWACVVAKQHGHSDAAYICSSISLQTQAMTFAAKCVDGGHVTAAMSLFGTDNYACAEHLERLVSTDNRENLMKLMKSNRRVDATTDFFKQVLDDGRRKPRASDVFWTTSMKKRWVEHAKAYGIHEEQANAIWATVCAGGGKCKCLQNVQKAFRTRTVNEELAHIACPYARSRCLAKVCDLLIMNMSYMATSEAHRSPSTKTLLVGRFIVVDEAHEFPSKMQPVYDKVSLSPLNLNAVRELRDELQRVGAPIMDKLSFDSAAMGAFASVFGGVGGAGADRRSGGFRETECIAFDNVVLRSAMQSASATYEPTDHAIVNAWIKRSATEIEARLEKYNTPAALVDFDSMDGITREEVESGSKVSLKDADTNANAFVRALEFLTARLFARMDGNDAWNDAQRALFDTIRLLRPNAHPSICIEVNQTILSVLRAVHNGKVACDRNAWRHKDNPYRDQTPIAHEGGLRFELSSRDKATALSEHVWTQHAAPLFMSATLAHASSFGYFEELLGLSLETKVIAKSPFDPTRRLFVFPPLTYPYDVSMMKRRVAGGTTYSLEYQKERMDLVSKYVSMTPRSTLIIGASYDDIRQVKTQLQAKFSQTAHIDFSDADAFARFCADPLRRAIVYGVDSLATGVDLPGRVGLVIILKQLNKPMTTSEKYAQTVLGLQSNMWSHYKIRRLMRFTQAAGRLMRTVDDSGVVLFFPPARWDGGEGEAVKAYYDASPVHALASWPHSQ